MGHLRETELGPSGRALWDEITEQIDLDPGDSSILYAACAIADEIDGLEQSVREIGVVVPTTRGSVKNHPALSQLVTHRLGQAKLIAQLFAAADDNAKHDGRSGGQKRTTAYRQGQHRLRDAG